MPKQKDPHSLTLRRIPPDVTRILNREKGKAMSSRGVLISKESIIYTIIRDWYGKKKEVTDGE